MTLLHVSYFFLLWSCASKGGRGPGLSGPLRGPACVWITFTAFPCAVVLRLIFVRGKSRQIASGMQRPFPWRG
jgi:hypothetical protein